MQHSLTQKTEVKSEFVEEFTFTKKELQHFVDIYFDVVSVTMHQIIDHGVTKEQFYRSSSDESDSLREKYMKNAAYHLRETGGIDTHPIGSSWGAIVDKKFRELFPVESRF